jgi:putative membrane-bound dehydrogenase-like protein
MRFTFAFCVAVFFTVPLRAQTGLKVPAGFEVVEFADGKLANDIHCMTVDPRGRVIVSGRGYLRILVDDDGDGKADRAIDFANEPKDGAMGLLWESDTLFAMGDGGLLRFTSKTGDKADGPSTLIRVMKTGGEHTSHAIRRGPDGWLYILGGNTAGIDQNYADLPTSPIKQPIAGCVIRLQTDLKKCEIVAHGFRNPYSMDFNLDGELFTYDSDNERCVSLPWYEPTRFYHVMEGGHYGWLNPQFAVTWRRPPYFADVVAPIATLGRGSPTGVACYRHNQFPPDYHGGFFLCDWTFGKVHFASLERNGPSYTSKTRVFLESVGDNGFAPTACAVNEKTGDLFISIGGRGTRGAVYRVRHADRYKTMKNELAPLAIKPSPTRARVKALENITVPHGLEQLRASIDLPRRLEGVRILQLALGDIGSRKTIGTIWEGYSPRHELKDEDTARKLAAMFPTNQVELDRELARTLGMIAWADDDLRARMLDRCGINSDPASDIHYLAVYARLLGQRLPNESKTVAGLLLDLDRKIMERKWNRDTNWASRVRELYIGLAEKDEMLHQALVGHRQFGRADHALFATTPGFPKQRAARVFLNRWQSDKDFALSGAIVQLFETLPSDEVLPMVRRRWGDTGQEAAFLPLLARQPTAADRGKFIDGLNSPQTTVLEACVQGLTKLNIRTDANETFALIRALRRTSDKQNNLRKVLTQRLHETTMQTFGNDNQRWIGWLEKQHPEFGKRLANPDGVDVAKWNDRLAKIDWTKGERASGKAVFAKANCATCHSGSQALGPDLVGVTKRFSRADLFTAILQPSKDVPARYQTTLVETRDGKTYQGIVIYDAVDNLMLQTGASTTVRLDGASVANRAVTAQSLMPAGLLDAVSDGEVADLYAYLRNP